MCSLNIWAFAFWRAAFCFRALYVGSLSPALRILCRLTARSAAEFNWCASPGALSKIQSRSLILIDSESTARAPPFISFNAYSWSEVFNFCSAQPQVQKAEVTHARRTNIINGDSMNARTKCW